MACECGVMVFDQVLDRSGTGSLKWEKYKKRDILPFWVADMDFESPKEVIEALHERVDHGVFGYTLPPDTCVNAVLDYLLSAHGFEAKADWIVWTPGLVPVLNMACRAFARPGDAILSLTPVYYPFLSAPEYAGMELQTVAFVENPSSRTWEVDFDAMERTVNSHSKVMLLSSPHNPLGRCFSKEELEKIGEFAIRHNLILCSDEIHCDLLFDEAKHISMGTMDPSILERTILMFAPSKTYNLAGLSCAFLVIPDARVRRTFQNAIRGIITEVNCLGYAACEAAYRLGEPWRKALISYLQTNRDLVYETVNNDFDGVSMTRMQATYLAWLDVRPLGLEKPAEYFEKFGVGLSEGSVFHGNGFVRLNFGCPRSVLEEGLHRIKQGLVSLSHD
jgi:cystathionine beta-lyase